MLPHLILASASPRRKDLLGRLGVFFETIPSEVSENEQAGETHEVHVKRLAELKAFNIAEKRRESLVIGADTSVILGDLRLGKPDSKERAKEMLQLLSGVKHEVLTGLAVIGINLRIKQVEIEKTGVWFKKLTASQIDEYVESSEPYDKAGGYGIQGAASCFIEKVVGDVNNIIGLPLYRLVHILGKLGFTFPQKFYLPESLS